MNRAQWAQHTSDPLIYIFLYRTIILFCAVISFLTFADY